MHTTPDFRSLPNRGPLRHGTQLRVLLELPARALRDLKKHEEQVSTRGGSYNSLARVQAKRVQLKLLRTKFQNTVPGTTYYLNTSCGRSRRRCRRWPSPGRTSPGGPRTCVVKEGSKTRRLANVFKNALRVHQDVENTSLSVQKCYVRSERSRRLFLGPERYEALPARQRLEGRASSAFPTPFGHQKESAAEARLL